MLQKDLERFEAQFEKRQPDQCWSWTGCTQRGYGRFGAGGKSHAAHRWFYELQHGSLLEGLQLDHLCRNRACVNPAHLEPVTRKENILRGVCPSAENARKTHCPQGHLLSGLNLRLKKVSGRPAYRVCRLCEQAAEARRWARKHPGGKGKGHYVRTPETLEAIRAGHRARVERQRCK